MSNGVFEIHSYTDDDDDVHAIRIQPETLALTIDGVANASAGAAGDRTAPIAKVSGGKSQYGLTARSVTIQMPAAPTGGYKPFGLITLPWLNPDTWPKRGVGAGVGVYNGNAITFVGRSPERQR